MKYPDQLDQVNPNEGNTSLHNQAVGLLAAAAYLKVPLIIIDCLVIAIELLFG